MSETWRPIPGFLGYEASDQGQLRSLKGDRARTLRPSTDKQGYLYVGLWNDGAHHTKGVHRLVALAFLGPRPAGLQTRHLDGDPTNNAVSNLRYGTASENQYDKVRHGRHSNAVKTHCPQGHEYNEANTYVLAARPNVRYCRECRAADSRRRYVKRKTAKAAA